LFTGEKLGPLAGLVFSVAFSAEHDPVHGSLRHGAEQVEEARATTDLDVIAVRA
jgi:hypothetical protein